MNAHFACIRTSLRYILVVLFKRTLFMVTGSPSPASRSEVIMDGSTFFLYILQLRAKLEQKLRPARIRDEEMKKYLRLAMCVVALACTTMMTSCEKEFLPGGGSETDELIGWWKTNAESYCITADGERYSYGEALIAFFENNLMLCGDAAQYRYTHDGDNITIYDGYCGGDGHGTIKKLTKDKLIYDVTWEDGYFDHIVCDRME